MKKEGKWWKRWYHTRMKITNRKKIQIEQNNEIMTNLKKKNDVDDDDDDDDKEYLVILVYRSCDRSNFWEIDFLDDFNIVNKEHTFSSTSRLASSMARRSFSKARCSKSCWRIFVCQLTSIRRWTWSISLIAVTSWAINSTMKISDFRSGAKKTFKLYPFDFVLYYVTVSNKYYFSSKK